MKVNIWPIVSKLHKEGVITKETKSLLDELKKKSSHEFRVVSIDELYDADLSIILVQSGGSEKLFLDNYENLKPPYYLLTYGTNNSLAASLEILSYIRDNSLEGEVLHGSTEYLLSRINDLLNNKESNSKYRYGVIGMPSNWLIASKVNPDDALKHGIKLVDISIKELEDEYNKETKSSFPNDLNFDRNELEKSFRLSSALEKIRIRHNLDGITIRCFDLLGDIHTTACMGLAIMNKDGHVGSCEADIPSMVSMHILNLLTGLTGFQANPARIDTLTNTVIFAHCTLPLSMVDSFTLKTHYESGIGVAIKGEMKEGVVTIFKLAKDLKHYFVSKGEIVENLSEDNLCRTQIKIKFDKDVSYFLNRPYGNHHIIVYGDHVKEIEEYMNNIK